MSQLVQSALDGYKVMNLGVDVWYSIFLVQLALSFTSYNTATTEQCFHSCLILIYIRLVINPYCTGAILFWLFVYNAGLYFCLWTDGVRKDSHNARESWYSGRGWCYSSFFRASFPNQSVVECSGLELSDAGLYTQNTLRCSQNFRLYLVYIQLGTLIHMVTMPNGLSWTRFGCS